ncbi:hypothetical protein ACFZBE_40950 [Streptomyces sp. NPDC008061]|uniref:hypothetical protein n=1 Tax=Streptomyces sp. NPDC008061 TaxID=3364805 RepID=UPI0036E5FECB
MELGPHANNFSRDLPFAETNEFRTRYELNAAIFEARLGGYLSRRPESVAALREAAGIALDEISVSRSLSRDQIKSMRATAGRAEIWGIVQLLMDIAHSGRLKKINGGKNSNLSREDIVRIREEMSQRKEWDSPYDPSQMDKGGLAGTMSVILELGLALAESRRARVNLQEIFLGVTGVLLDTQRFTLHEIMNEARHWDRLDTGIFDLPYVDGFSRYRHIGRLGESELRSNVAVGKLFPDEIAFALPPRHQSPYITGLDALRYLGIEPGLWATYLETIASHSRPAVSPEARLRAWSDYMPAILVYEEVKSKYRGVKKARKSDGRQHSDLTATEADLEKYVWQTWAISRVAHEKLLQMGHDPAKIREKFDTWVADQYPNAPLSSLKWRRSSTPVGSAGIPNSRAGTHAASSRVTDVKRQPQDPILPMMPTHSRTPANPHTTVRAAHLDAPLGESSSRYVPSSVPRVDLTPSNYGRIWPDVRTGGKWTQLPDIYQREILHLVFRELTRQEKIPADWENQAAVAYDMMDQSWKSQARIQQANKIALYILTKRFEVVRGGARTEADPLDPETVDIRREPSHEMEPSATLGRQGTEADAGQPRGGAEAKRVREVLGKLPARRYHALISELLDEMGHTPVSLPAGAGVLRDSDPFNGIPDPIREAAELKAYNRIKTEQEQSDSPAQDPGGEHDGGLVGSSEGASTAAMTPEVRYAVEQAQEKWRTERRTAKPYDGRPDRVAAVAEEVAKRLRLGQPPVPFLIPESDTARPDGRQFGIEIEFGKADNAGDWEEQASDLAAALHSMGLMRKARLDSHHLSHSTGYTTHPDDWRLERESVGWAQAELISPIMSDQKRHWQDIERVLRVLRGSGWQAHRPENGWPQDGSMGGHIHVSTGHYGASADGYRALLEIIGVFEDVLFRLGSTWRVGGHRGVAMGWPSRTNWLPGRDEDLQSLVEQRRSLLHAVNLDSVEGNPSDHVEFRWWDGSLDPAEWQVRVKLSEALVQAAFRLSQEQDLTAVLGEAEALGAHAGSARQEILYQGSHGGSSATVYRDSPESTGSLLRMLDLLFNRDEDKDQVLALFVLNSWASDNALWRVPADDPRFAWVAEYGETPISELFITPRERGLALTTWPGSAPAIARQIGSPTFEVFLEAPSSDRRQQPVVPSADLTTWLPLTPEQFAALIAANGYEAGQEIALIGFWVTYSAGFLQWIADVGDTLNTRVIAIADAQRLPADTAYLLPRYELFTYADVGVRIDTSGIDIPVSLLSYTPSHLIDRAPTRLGELVAAPLHRAELAELAGVAGRAMEDYLDALALHAAHTNQGDSSEPAQTEVNIDRASAALEDLGITPDEAARWGDSRLSSDEDFPTYGELLPTGETTNRDLHPGRGQANAETTQHNLIPVDDHVVREARRELARLSATFDAADAFDAEAIEATALRLSQQHRFPNSRALAQATALTLCAGSTAAALGGSRRRNAATTLHGSDESNRHAGEEIAGSRPSLATRTTEPALSLQERRRSPDLGHIQRREVRPPLAIDDQKPDSRRVLEELVAGVDDAVHNSDSHDDTTADAAINQFREATAHGRPTGGSQQQLVPVWREEGGQRFFLEPSALESAEDEIEKQVEATAVMLSAAPGLKEGGATVHVAIAPGDSLQTADAVKFLSAVVSHCSAQQTARLTIVLTLSQGSTVNLCPPAS